MTDRHDDTHPTAATRADQDQWRRVRGYLNRHRWALTRIAAGLYPATPRVEGTPLLALPEWLPDHPVELGQVRLSWHADAAPPAVDGRGATSAHVRPWRAVGERFPGYADAVAALARPALFEDRATYRLLDVSWSPPGVGALGFTAGSYFQLVNTCEAVAHELAAAGRGAADPATAEAGVPWDALPLRAAVGDPFDLRARPVFTGVSVLTLRRDTRTGEAGFVLHRRDPARVASGGGLYQVMPVGMFQPSTTPPPGQPGDLDLWRAMVREYSEEFLGHPERHGRDGAPLDYENWPLYRTLDQARAEGRVRVFCLGLGVDPLTLVTDILMVAVFDAEVFDEVFAGLVATNPEGDVITTVTTNDGGCAAPGAQGLPFTRDIVDHYTRTQPMQPAGAAVLTRAWHHRDAILAR